MEYVLSPNFRVDFTAHAPLHRFKGWTVKGIDAVVDIDFDACELHGVSASADTHFFDTGDSDRNKAMADYMAIDKSPNASIEMIQCHKFLKLDPATYRISIQALLEFMGIRRQLPVTFTVKRKKECITIEADLKWSFKAYGLKAPQLLFLKVRDIVDIQGIGEFVLAKA